jgi:16S rRNA (guanine527-N7)-methyltransferase
MTSHTESSGLSERSESNGLASALTAEAGQIGVSLSTAQVATLLHYRRLIEQWTSRAGLTALRDPRHVVRLHFVDSLLCLGVAAFPSGGSVIDVGSGAGLPGIPLMIARPDLRVTLLEPAARKAAFLELAAAQLGLSCEVVAARAESAGRDIRFRERFDVAVARAVAPLLRLVELTLPFARIGGSVVLLKGPSVLTEIQSAEAIIAELGGGAPRAVESRLAGGERRAAIVIVKGTATPEQFPRRAPRPRPRVSSPTPVRRHSEDSYP